ncbi:hypothetical protein ABFV47_32820 [Mycolicibacterium fortuitum]|uniref:hypothetical protein n=1 Tax=Mycolicibacterium TaxID=1866885 RepID=UPI003204DF91
MLNSYIRGGVTLTVNEPIGADNVTFTITRAAPLTDDEVRRINLELADYTAAHGAQLIQSPSTGEWEIRVDATVVATDNGNPTAPLQWTARR